MNWIERWLNENCRTVSWLSKQTKIPISTMRYKIKDKTNEQLLHTLSYHEYITLENILQ